MEICFFGAARVVEARGIRGRLPNETVSCLKTVSNAKWACQRNSTRREGERRDASSIAAERWISRRFQSRNRSVMTPFALWEKALS